MKQLNFTFGRPEGLWNAALLSKEEMKYELVKQLNERPQKLIDIKGIPEFILLSYRNFETEINNPKWNTQKTMSGTPTAISHGSSDFKHLIKWQSYPSFAIPLAGLPKLTNILISSTIKTILEKFNLFETQFIPVNVVHELTQEKREYYILNAIQDHYIQSDKMHWPSMEWYYIKKETNEIIAEFKKGSIDSAETFWKELEKHKPKEIMELMKYEVIIPEYIFEEDYDALMRSFGYLFTEEVAAMIKQEAGLETVVPFDKLQVFTGAYKSK